MGRNSVEIRAWMVRRKIKLVDVQRSLGFADHKTVWSTIEGREHNRKVLSWLLDNGCPKKLLALPDDMRKAA